MFTASETPVVATVVLVAFCILGWGFLRARPLGKLGILAWLQSVTLITPWLVFFGLFAAGIYVNLIGFLSFVLVSVGIYIAIGSQLRAAGQDAILRQKAAERIAATQQETTQNPQSGEMEFIQLELVPIPEEDMTAIRGIFGIDTFFATETIPYQEGAIFKGNLRAEPEPTLERLTGSLEERLPGKYRLFLVENTEGKPVFVVLPTRNDPRPSTIPQKAFAGILGIATLGTSLEAAGILQGFDFFSTPLRYGEVLPIGIGIFIILLAHEIGHWVMANRHQVRLSWPFLLPAVQIGSFGAITRFESILPNRKALFDIAIAGPAAGGIVAFVMLVIGLALSGGSQAFQLPREFFQGSVLVGALAKVVLGSNLQSSLIAIHPLVIIGWVGLVITALNLVPAGQLDGGRIIQAIYGRKTVGRTTFASVAILGIVGLGNPIALYWVIVILFLQRNLERPSLNEITEPDDARAALGLLALFLMIATLLPLTPDIAGKLGLG